MIETVLQKTQRLAEIAEPLLQLLHECPYATDFHSPMADRVNSGRWNGHALDDAEGRLFKLDLEHTEAILERAKSGDTSKNEADYEETSRILKELHDKIRTIKVKSANYGSAFNQQRANAYRDAMDSIGKKYGVAC